MNDQQKELVWKAFDQQRWQYFRVGRRMAKNALKKHIDPVLKLLEERGAEVAYNNYDAFVDQEPLRKFYERLYTTVGVPFSERSFESLQGKQKQEDEYYQRVMRYLGIAINDRLDAVTQTTKGHIAEWLGYGLRTGQSIQDMSARIASEAGGVTRATRIARTEIISASNLGSIEGARSTGLPLDKTWLATPGGRTRETHAEADGQTVPMEELFSVGGSQLDFPGDWSHNADVSELVNCRCTTIYKVRRT
ncbi:phage minor head protein [Gracilimonas sp.]|uniref:phage minor head protein n=1 Tax=Gracilimonas sp. TaxID=1974203 RepID=UPI002872013D|nr:phage minor head protein [Gracilimonas sp.]